MSSTGKRSRRTFLKQSGALAAGTVFATSCAAPSMTGGGTGKGRAAKTVLAVAVGAPLPTISFNDGQCLPADLRPIIVSLVARLAINSYALGTDYTLDYIQDMKKRLNQRIKTYLRNPNRPQNLTIFTVASSATIAALKERGNQQIPVIFTVISDLVNQHMEKEPLLKGVQTGLAPDMANCVKVLRDIATVPGQPLLVQTFRTKSHYAANQAWQALLHLVPTPDPTLAFNHTELGIDSGDDLLGKIGDIKKPQDGRRVLIFVIPDDAVYARWLEILSLAQDEMGIPVFFQQLETVKPNTADPTESAFGARGMPADLIGSKAADMIKAVMDNPTAIDGLSNYNPADPQNNFSELKTNFSSGVAAALGMHIPAGYARS